MNFDSPEEEMVSEILSGKDMSIEDLSPEALSILSNQEAIAKIAAQLLENDQKIINTIQIEPLYIELDPNQIVDALIGEKEKFGFVLVDEGDKYRITTASSNANDYSHTPEIEEPTIEIEEIPPYSFGKQDAKTDKLIFNDEDNFDRGIIQNAFNDLLEKVENGEIQSGQQINIELPNGSIAPSIKIVEDLQDPATFREEVDNLYQRYLDTLYEDPALDWEAFGWDDEEDLQASIVSMKGDFGSETLESEEPKIVTPAYKGPEGLA